MGAPGQRSIDWNYGRRRRGVFPTRRREQAVDRKLKRSLRTDLRVGSNIHLSTSANNTFFFEPKPLLEGRFGRAPALVTLVTISISG
jgi:hypothetical protein